MPTYEYQCEKCDHAFEVFQGISDKPISKCPECRGRVKRLIGKGAGIIFKGSGFYQTDYRSESYRSKAKAESAAPSHAASGSASASGTKAPEAPAAKHDAGAKTKSDAKKSAHKA
ncbi:MAG: zinc ribbon domain-containing protein [Lentisphaerae bacterium]|jgi:putative FmdB family regulatory protein|nr:zinc ribbon domain-containing protein [Lentisphaerota bacterium]